MTTFGLKCLWIEQGCTQSLRIGWLSGHLDAYAEGIAQLGVFALRPGMHIPHCASMKILRIQKVQMNNQSDARTIINPQVASFTYLTSFKRVSVPGIHII